MSRAVATKIFFPTSFCKSFRFNLERILFLHPLLGKEPVSSTCIPYACLLRLSGTLVIKWFSRCFRHFGYKLTFWKVSILYLVFGDDTRIEKDTFSELSVRRIQKDPKATKGHNRPQTATKGHKRPQRATKGHKRPQTATNGHKRHRRPYSTTVQ